MTTSETGYETSDADAKATLQQAVDIVQGVLNMVHTALNMAGVDDANFLHQAELQAQRLKVEHSGVKPGERSILRAHPLFALWKLALKAASQLERLLSVTNPALFAQRVVTLDAARELAKAERLAERAQSVA